MPKEEVNLDLGTRSDDSDDPAEFIKIHRQYRKLDGGRRSDAAKIRACLDKQKKFIKAFEREKKELIRTIEVTESKQSLLLDKQQTESLATLIEKYDELKKTVESERAQIAKMIDENQVMRRKIDYDVIYFTKVRTGEAHEVSSEKIQRLEQQVGWITLKFDETRERNRQLSEQVSHLAKERSRFNKNYKKLVRQLMDGRKHISEIVTQASRAFDEREEAYAQLELLRERSEKEHIQNTLELQGLQRILNHNSKTLDFMRTKTMERKIDVGMDSERAKRRQKSTMSEMVNMTVSEATTFYLDILNVVSNTLGSKHAKEMSKSFKRLSENNFSISAYVIEENRDIESLCEQIEAMEREIEEISVTMRTEIETKQSNIKLREVARNEKREQTRITNANLNDSEEKVTRILSQVRSLFDSIGCEEGELLETLGNDGTITIDNVLKYMEVIDQRTLRLLMAQDQLEFEEKDNAGKKEVLKPPVVKNEIVLPVQATSPVLQCAPPPIIDEGMAPDGVLRPVMEIELRKTFEQGVIDFRELELEIQLNNGNEEGEAIDALKSRVEHSQSFIQYF